MGDNGVLASPDAIDPYRELGVGNASEVSQDPDVATVEDGVARKEAPSQTSSEQVGLQGLGRALRQSVVPSYGTTNGHNRRQNAPDTAVNWRGLEVSD